MEYVILQGLRARSRVLYVPQDKMLYVSKCRRRGQEEFICYQTILCAQKKGNNENQKCTARVIVDDSSKCCVRNKVPHSSHCNHEELMNIMETTNNIKEKCDILRKKFPILSKKIRPKDIFYDEVAK